MRYIPLWGVENQRYWEGEYPPRTANNIGKSARIRYLSEITHRGTRLVKKEESSRVSVSRGRSSECGAELGGGVLEGWRWVRCGRC